MDISSYKSIQSLNFDSFDCARIQLYIVQDDILNTLDIFMLRPVIEEARILQQNAYDAIEAIKIVTLDGSKKLLIELASGSLIIRCNDLLTWERIRDLRQIDHSGVTFPSSTQSQAGPRPSSIINSNAKQIEGLFFTFLSLSRQRICLFLTDYNKSNYTFGISTVVCWKNPKSTLINVSSNTGGIQVERSFVSRNNARIDFDDGSVMEITADLVLVSDFVL